ncbi:MAG: polysaccharide deacetylase family protein [Pseudomonadota bacterium]
MINKLFKKVISTFLLSIVALFLFTSCFNKTHNIKYLTNKHSVPLITFVFDDGNDTDYLVAKDIFGVKGEVACSAIVTDWINTKNYLTVSQLQELQDDGWEILSHTKSHPKLTTLSEKQINDELYQSKVVLEQLGLKVNNLVYPYNKYNDDVIKIAVKYYRSVRGGHKIKYITIPEQYQLVSYANKHTFNKIKGIIDNASSEKQWLILFHHRIDARIKYFNKKGRYLPEEILCFEPSGATGKFIKENGIAILFVPLSGTPLINDTVTGRNSGTTSVLSKVDYNDRESIAELIEYIHTNHPDMRFVTINEALDITIASLNPHLQR